MNKQYYTATVLKFQPLPTGWWNYYQGEDDEGKPTYWRIPCPGLVQVKVEHPRNGAEVYWGPGEIIDNQLANAEIESLNSSGAYYRGAFFGDSTDEVQMCDEHGKPLDK